MLRVFFEKSEDDTTIYFKDKKIWACGKEYQEYQGKYPVIYVIFKDVKYEDWESAYDLCYKILRNEIERHNELLVSDRVVSFGVNEEATRTQYIIMQIYNMAKEMGAFVLHHNMHLFRADGKLLISIDGKTDFEEFYPSTHILKNEKEESQEDIARKERSIAILEEKNIPYVKHLRASVPESDCKIPDKAEIVHRLICIFSTCVRSEVYTCGRYENPSEKAKEQYDLLNEQYNIKEWLSPEEKELLVGVYGVTQWDDVKTHT